MSQINWYPGHMARSRRLLEEQRRAVNVVIELCDARAPAATRNPDLVRLSRGKTRILVLNKADLADDAQTARWLAHYRAQGITALRFNANGGKTKDIRVKRRQGEGHPRPHRGGVETCARPIRRARRAQNTARHDSGYSQRRQIHIRQSALRREYCRHSGPSGRYPRQSLDQAGTVSGNTRYARYAAPKVR